MIPSRFGCCAALIAAAAVPVAAQVSVGPHGVRSGNTVVDGTGVHTGTTSVTSGGVSVRGAPRRGSGTTIRTNGNRRSVDCAGGALEVDGNANHLTVTGCTAVTVNGNVNELRIDYPASGRLDVMGNRNRVTWRAAPGVRVAVSAPGTRNVVTRR